MEKPQEILMLVTAVIGATTLWRLTRDDYRHMGNGTDRRVDSPAVR